MIIFKWWILCLLFTTAPPVWLYYKYKQNMLDEFNIQESIFILSVFWCFALGIAIGRMVLK